MGARKLTPNEQLVSAVRIALLRYDLHREHQAEARSALDAAMLIQYPGQTIPHAEYSRVCDADQTAPAARRPPDGGGE